MATRSRIAIETADGKVKSGRYLQSIRDNYTKNKTPLISYTFYLDGYEYATALKSEAKEFGKFKKIGRISKGTIMGDCFKVVGTLDDIKEFHKAYGLDGRGIWFEDTFCRTGDPIQTA